jgi:hypothetical protein
VVRREAWIRGGVVAVLAVVVSVVDMVGIGVSIVVVVGWPWGVGGPEFGISMLGIGEEVIVERRESDIVCEPRRGRLGGVGSSRQWLPRRGESSSSSSSSSSSMGFDVPAWARGEGKPAVAKDLWVAAWELMCDEPRDPGVAVGRED